MDEHDNTNEPGTAPSPETEATPEVLADQKQETDKEEQVEQETIAAAQDIDEEEQALVATPEDQQDKEDQQVLPEQAPPVNNNEKDFMLKEDKQFTEGNTFDPRTFTNSNSTEYDPCKVKALLIAVVLIIIAGFVVRNAVVQSKPRNKYPDCKPIFEKGSGNDYLSMLGDGHCDRSYFSSSNLNSEDCGYDAGDCDDFNKKYENCVPGTHPSELDFGGVGYTTTCQKRYNTEACGFDLGLCTKFNLNYPNCETDYISGIGDGICAWYSGDNTKECGWDGGDCIHYKFPNCTGINPFHFYTDWCDLDLNRKECGFDNGACNWFNKNYPNCTTVSSVEQLNNQKCYNSADYNNENCGYDGGDCIDFNKKYPDCTVEQAYMINDTICHNDRSSFNTAECGFDGGDCDEFNKNELYTECDALYVSRLGDGKCDGALTDEASGYNSEQCAFDGGDCTDFNEKYPECPFYNEMKRLGGKSTC
jgi:hypothetical protein